MNLSFSHSLKLYKEVALDIGAAFGYLAGHGTYFQTYEHSTGDYTGPGYNGFHDGMVKAGITVPITKALTIHPRIEYWFPLSGKAKKSMGYDAAGEKISYNPDGYLACNIVAGINITYAF